MGKGRVGGVVLLALCASAALSCVGRTTDVRIRTAWEGLPLDEALARYHSSGPDEVTPEARAALRRRLEEISVQELLDLQKRHSEVFPTVTPSFRRIPPAEIVDRAEHMAHVRTLGSTIEKDALIDNILNGRWGPLLVTVEFQVISSYPPLNEVVINVRGGLHRDDLDRI